MVLGSASIGGSAEVATAGGPVSGIDPPAPMPPTAAEPIAPGLLVAYPFGLTYVKLMPN